MSNYSDDEMELGKLFDSLRFMKACKLRFAGKEKKIEIDGGEYVAESIAEGMLILDMRRLRELVDMSEPFWADFISEFEQLPGMDVSMKKYEQFKAAEMSVAG